MCLRTDVWSAPTCGLPLERRGYVVRATDPAGRDSTTDDDNNAPLDPEVEAFAKWFADWWLRRGSRLYAAAKKADPDRFNKKSSEAEAAELPHRWDEETGRIVVDTEREADG